MSSRASTAAVSEHADSTPGTREHVVPIWLVVTTLAGLGVILPVLVADRFGALGVARGDDVAYLSSAFRFFDEGRIDGARWAAMNLVGQLVAAVPVVAIAGRRIAALQIEIAAIGFVGLLATYDLARRVVSSTRALFVASLVALSPLWLGVAPTFLTDVPAFALATISLALGARAITRGRVHGWLLGASFVVGFAGFTVREYAIVAPLAVGLALLFVVPRRNERLTLVICLTVLTVGSLAFLAWRLGLPGFMTSEPATPTRGAVASTARRLAQSVLLTGIMLTPAVLLAGPGRVVRAAWARARRTTVAVVGTFAIAMVVDTVVSERSADFFAPDRYLSNQWALAPGYRALLPSGIAPVLELIGACTVAVMLCCAIPPAVDAVARVRERRPSTASPVQTMIAISAFGYAAVYLATSLAGSTYFPRYLLPILPLLALLVLTSAGADAATPRLTAVSIVALVLLGTVGIAAAATNASLDGARWAVASEASRIVGSPALVDGGFEWNNSRFGEIEYWLRRPPDTCVRVRYESAPPTGASVVSRERVWTVGDELWIAARRVRDCPDPT